MKDDDLVIALGHFYEDIRKEMKGLAARVVWYLYGSEWDYAHGVEEGEALEGGFHRLPKTRVDFETYVVLYGAGAMQGHATGGAERRAGGGWTGKLEDRREIQYIHQILAPNLSSLKVQCGLSYPALSARVLLMNEEPHRTAAILGFQEYLRSIYRSVVGGDAETLLERLAVLPGHIPPAELFARWKQVEVKLKAEKRPAIYEVKDGKFFVYEKVGKTNRLVNGWLYGVDTPPPESDSGAVEIGSDYDQRLKEASFGMRMKLLESEAVRLLGDGSDELIALVADHKSGALTKILATVDHLAELAESNTLQESHKPIAKLLIDRMNRMAATVIRKPKLLAACGIEPELIRERQLQAQKMKRKV